MMKNILIIVLIFLTLSALGVTFFAARNSEEVQGILGKLFPTPTPKPFTIKGIAVIGDSQSDEYRGDDSRGGIYADTTLNWVEQIEKKRKLNFGSWDTWNEPRRTGYEYNWARSGATTYSLLVSGQHVGVSEQIKSKKVNLVIIYIGANDFAPYNREDGYQAIYEGNLSDVDVRQKVNRMVADITTAIDTIRESGNVKIILVKVPDWGHHVPVQIAFPLPDGRQRVTDAVEVVNTQLERVATERSIPTVDPNAFYRELLDDSDTDKIKVGELFLSKLVPSDDPKYAFLSDGIHPGTILNGLFANYIIEHLNTKVGTQIKPFTKQEILENAGIFSSR